MARFDIFNAENNAEPQTNGHSNGVNGVVGDTARKTEPESPPTHSRNSVKREAEEDEYEVSAAPASPSPKKKRKLGHLDDDAAFAAKLQAEENSRARATRGGVNKKPTSAKKKKPPKKKTTDRIRAEDDSDLDGSGSEVHEKKVNRNGGFHVSASLSIYLHMANACSEINDPINALIGIARRGGAIVATTDGETNMGLR